MKTQRNFFRRYTIRLYPNKKQTEKFLEHTNCCRFTWNYFLNMENDAYEKDKTFIGRFDMIKMITNLKKSECDWLKNVSNTSLQIICTDLYKSFKRFFNNISNRPRFKSKKDGRLSFPIRSEHIYFTKDNLCNIEKIGKVKFKTDLELIYGQEYGNYKDARVVYENGKWFLSVLVSKRVISHRCDSQTPNISDQSLMGIDWGVKNLATVAFNDKFIVYPNINKSAKMKNLERVEKRIRKNISRKRNTNEKLGIKEKSNNIIREENKLRKICKKQSNIRYNYNQQVTTELTNLFPSRITTEHLSIASMVKDKCLAKLIKKLNFHSFMKMLKYKCEDRGIEFVQASRFYPSSKTCSKCGYIKKDLKLSDRVYVCPVCGLKMDRDYNAAVNLKNYMV